MSMELEYEYLLDLLGCYLTGRAPQPRNDADWQKLKNLADIHSVTGILGYMNMQYRLCPDPAMSAALRQMTLVTLSRFTQRGALLDQFCGMLQDAGIEHILMKGSIIRHYYPVSELRTFGDIDMVIHSEDREKCHQLMLDAGFQTKEDWEPVFSYFRGQEFYEIHTDIMEEVSDKADYQAYFSQMWEHTVLKSGSTLEFTPEFHFLYLLTHIAKHIAGCGAGARMYLDIGAFILHFGDKVDWAWVEGELRKIKLWDFARVAFTAVEHWFGVTCPVKFEAIADDVMAEFLLFTMEAGTFGHFQRENAMAKLKKNEADSSSSRWKLLLTRLFPPVQNIAARYTYLQKMPWLLPVAWIHRLIITWTGFSRHAHEAQVILSADTAEVSRMHRLMRDIGL